MTVLTNRLPGGRTNFADLLAHRFPGGQEIGRLLDDELARLRQVTVGLPTEHGYSHLQPGEDPLPPPASSPLVVGIGGTGSNGTGPGYLLEGTQFVTPAVVTTKGDVYVYGTGPTRLPVGPNGEPLTADSAQALGMKWGSLVLRPAQVTADQHDYAPAGGFGLWYVSTDASRNFTGVAVAAALDGTTIFWINNGAQDEVLQHENAGSVVGNRLLCPGAADLTLNANEAAILRRDATAARWRVFAL